MRTAAWQLRAGCVDADPETFFPIGDAGPAVVEQVRAAKAICGGCAVRAECLEFALRALPFGIAGGLTPEERRGLSAGASALVERDEPPPQSRRESAARGRAAIRNGRSVAEVAAEFGVTERTAWRWAAAARRAQAGAERDGRGVA